MYLAHHNGEKRREKIRVRTYEGVRHIVSRSEKQD